MSFLGHRGFAVSRFRGAAQALRLRCAANTGLVGLSGGKARLGFFVAYFNVFWLF